MVYRKNTGKIGPQIVQPGPGTLFADGHVEGIVAPGDAAVNGFSLPTGGGTLPPPGPWTVFAESGRASRATTRRIAAKPRRCHGGGIGPASLPGDA